MQCLPNAGVIRALGAEVAELPALAVRPELQGNSLGRLLLALLEGALREAGVKLIAMPALVPFPSSSPKQGLAPDGQITAAAADEQVMSVSPLSLRAATLPAVCLSQLKLYCLPHL